jgi:hypothetical protein
MNDDDQDLMDAQAHQLQLDQRRFEEDQTVDIYPEPFSPAWRLRMEAAQAKLRVLLRTRWVWP